MENTSTDKALNQIAIERAKDSQELKLLKEVQEKQQQGMQESQKQISGMKLDMGALKTTQQEFMERSSAPLKEMETLSSQMALHSELLKKPLTQKLVHEHHVPKLLYATVALFCLCITLAMGWYQSTQRLDQYRNNDTKWRRLLLDARPALTKIMQDVSTSIEQDPDKTREAVKAQEDHNAQVWELQQKMQADSASMRALKTDKPAGDNSSYIHKK